MNAVSEESRPDSVVAEILSGENRELQLTVARGWFPLPPEELIPIQVTLAGGSDEEIAAAANDSLLQFEPKIAANVLAEEATNEVISYFASRASHPVILEAILRKRNVDSEVLEKLATNLPVDLQEILLLRQDAIVDHPEILDRLEENPQVSSYTSRRIKEYREHLLPRKAAPRKSAQEIEREADALSSEEIEAALEVAGEQPRRRHRRSRARATFCGRPGS